MDSHNIHRNHRIRMRQNFIRNGCNNAFPHQLLEMLLFYTIPRADTNPTAHRLIEHFGNLEKVMNASAAELGKVRGIGPSTACFISAAAELCRRYQSDFREVRITDSADNLKAYFFANFPEFPDDHLLVAAVGPQREIIHCESISLSSLRESDTVTARFIAEIIIRCGSDRIAAGIFHTRQPALPTNSDFFFTHTIAETAKLLGSVLSDMIIYNANDSFSMKESGAFGFSQEYTE